MIYLCGKCRIFLITISPLQLISSFIIVSPIQVVHSRDDHVITVYYPDGTTVVEHADGTRITTVRQGLKMAAEDETTVAPATGKMLCIVGLNLRLVIISHDWKVIR